MKLKFFPFEQETPVPPCGSKLRSGSLYLLQFSRYWHFSIFRENPRWPPKVAKIELSPLCTWHSCTTLWGKKFARNRSISYGFRDIDTFSFSAKIQDGHRKWRKLKFSPFEQETLVPPCGSKIHLKSLYLLRFSRYWHFFIFRKNPRWPPKVAKIEIFHHWTGDSCTTVRVKNSLEIAILLEVIHIYSFAQDTLVPPCGSKICSKSLYLLRFSRYWLFFIFRKNPRWPPKVAKIEIIPLWTGDSCTTLWVKNLLEIALSLTVFEILTLFHFPRKSKMATKSGENWNFPPFHRTLLYHCVSQKFARNGSISYGFRDIDTFPFSAKIQDGRWKWRKLKFFPFA